jgi:hypothetical protein
LPKPNYSYAKRQREIAKKQKKEEKRRQKAQRAEETNPDAAIQATETDDENLTSDPQP